jgi:hypothetical protein
MKNALKPVHGPLSQDEISTLVRLRSRGLKVSSPVELRAEEQVSQPEKRFVFAKEDPEFIEIAEQNQWRTRATRGLPSRMCIFQFLKDTYDPWLGWMTQADLKAVDYGAWRALQNRLQKDELPSWLLLPKLSDRNLPKKGTNEYELRMEVRRQNRERMRLYRSL